MANVEWTIIAVVAVDEDYYLLEVTQKCRTLKSDSTDDYKRSYSVIEGRYFERCCNTGYCKDTKHLLQLCQLHIFAQKSHQICCGQASRFPLERWTLGLGFSCPHWTPMMDSIYPTWTGSWPDGLFFSHFFWTFLATCNAIVKFHFLIFAVPLL